MKPIVIFHGPTCYDGYCCAWVMHHFSGLDCDYLPAQYGDPPPDVTGREVYVLDFSYPRAALEEMHRKAAKLTVLDHHKTAEADLKGLPYCRFDMNLSGAQLTWQMLKPYRQAPWLVDYTADRDLWRFALPNSKEVNAGLRSYPLDFKVWDDLFERTPGSLIPEGTAILRAEEVTIKVHVARAREIEFDGHKVLCVNASTLFSEIAGELAVGRPFGMVWFERDDGIRQYSLRSRDGGVDVSEIAKAHGGGGHAAAAGFETAVP